jgi:syntaxin 7
LCPKSPPIAIYSHKQASQKYTQQKLSREFQASGNEFQAIQRLALEKQRASADAERTAIGSGGDASGNQPYRDEPGQQQQQQQQEQLRLAPQDEVDFQESLIIERESEIRNIEQSVGELNELFRDVAHIVREQGEAFDVIENNVQNTVQDTRGADLELRSASRYQKNARSKACCLLLVLSVILLIIILAAVLG